MSNQSLPYYKRYTRDILDGSVGLGFEAKCAYSVLIDLIYHHNNALRDSPRYIAGMLECSVRKWNSIRKTLIDYGKIQILDGIIRNLRADKETVILRSFQDKQAENRRKPNKFKAKSKPRSNQSESESEPLKIKNKMGEVVLAAIPDAGTNARKLCDLMLKNHGQAVWAAWFNGRKVIFDGDTIRPLNPLVKQKIEQKYSTTVSNSGMRVGDVLDDIEISDIASGGAS